MGFKKPQSRSEWDGWKLKAGRYKDWAMGHRNLDPPLKRWLRICSKMAAKFTNSSDESSMGSAVYFSSNVFTENLDGGQKEGEGGCQVRRVMVVEGCRAT